MVLSFKSRVQVVVGMVLILAVPVFCGCVTQSNPEIDRALEYAGDNRKELEDVLGHYADSLEKLEAAKFLIANLPYHYGYYGAELDTVESLLKPIMRLRDIYTIDAEKKKRWESFPFFSLPRRRDMQEIKASYLIDHIDRAYRQWKKRKWNKNLSLEDFCELILPYRIGDERLTPWRKTYEDRYATRLDSLYDGDDVLKACQVVMDQISKEGLGWYNDELSTPHRDALSLLGNRVGNCRDDCDRYIYALRACGIPVTSDHILVSPDNGTAHQWLAIRDNMTGRFLPCGYDEMPLTRDSIAWDRRKKGKVYRYGFGVNRERLEIMGRVENRSAGTAMVRYPLLRDMTSNYFGSNTVSVKIPSSVREAYLGVYAKGKFRVVDVGTVSGTGKVEFHDVEPGVFFFPITVDDAGETHLCGDAFIVNVDGSTRTLLPDTTRMTAMTLYRKMPLTWRHRRWMGENVVGSVLEGSLSPGFAKPDTLLHIREPLRLNYMRVVLPQARKYRYLRLSPPDGQRFLLAGLSLYAQVGDAIPLRYHVRSRLPDYFKEEYLTDNDLLTTYTAPRDCRSIIMEMEHASLLSAVEFFPRNDDNFVWPGQEYELLFLNGSKGWQSVGRKVATGHSIQFSAPSGALYLLRNLSKGKEEQVFIYETGHQKFCIDLPHPTIHLARLTGF